MNWTREEITTKLSEVRELGFVRTKRKGPTGVRVYAGNAARNPGEQYPSSGSRDIRTEGQA